MTFDSNKIYLQGDVDGKWFIDEVVDCTKISSQPDTPNSKYREVVTSRMKAMHDVLIRKSDSLMCELLHDRD